MFETTRLTRWREKVNYQGADYDAYFIAAYRPYRCTGVDRDIFNHVREHLFDIGAGPLEVIDVTCTDDVLHSRYYVLVHESYERGLKMADMFASRLYFKGTLTGTLTQDDFLDDPDPMVPFVSSTGHFSIIPGTLTTSTSRRKSKAGAKHAAAVARIVAATEELTGAPVMRYARKLDGVERRWKGVKSHQADT